MLGIVLQRDYEISLSRQIYQTLRERMVEGRVKAGEILPSTRDLAQQLAVSRNTVCEAYDMLLAEGYIISRQGAPSRVAAGLCIVRESGEKEYKKNQSHSIALIADFKTGQPDLRCFPRALWNQYLKKSIDDMPLAQLGYTGPEGLLQLREAIADWLFRSRGVPVDAQNIFITTGATHALHLLADLLCTGDKGLIIEDPCHIGMLRVLIGKGYPVKAVPVDCRGILTDHLPDRGEAAIYVTPSHQFPLGGILPADRRAALIRYAREQGVYIIEDDYDSEFRYSGEPVAPLCSMDTERVIYVGTFSKIMFPALRIGYVILPRSLQEKWRYLRTHTDVQNPPVEQAALAGFISERRLDKHIHRMRKIYGERRKILLQGIHELFGDGWKPWGDAAGLHLALEFPNMKFDQSWIKKIRDLGIRIATVEKHCINKGMHTDKLLLGYGHLNTEEIRKGIQILSAALQEMP